MKNVLVFALAVLWAALMSRFGALIASVLVLLLSAVGIWYYVRWKRVRLLREYGRRIENVYVLSRFPGDRTVLKRAAKERRLLEEAANKTGAEVRTILFADGENVNETWEEFEERARIEIAEDRKSRHSGLKSANNDWYLAYHHRQA